MASDDEENISNEDEYEHQDGKSGVIFLIDSRYSMFTQDVENDDGNKITRFNLALKCCKVQLLNKIIAKQKDLFGIVLFGTDKTDPKTNTKHVSLLLEPNYPGSEAILQLDKLLVDTASHKIQTDYGSSNEFLLSEALWFCGSLLTRRDSKSLSLDERRIVLFTDDCDPHGSDEELAYKARKKANDLKGLHITLDVVPIGSTDFDYSKFYKEIIESLNGPQDPGVFDPDPSTKLDDLLDSVNRLDFRRRRYAKLKWNLGNDVHLGISLYTLYREANILPAQPLNRATNEPVNRIKQIYDQATGELLLPSDVVEFLSTAGSDVAFTREEKDALNKIMEPGVVLLGFKPASVVTEGQHCGQPSFVFPEETLIKGSRKLMKALVERCIAKGKVAVCCMTPRYRALTKYFYLIPSEEEFDASGAQLSPCGFHAIPIPFDSEIREHSLDYSSEVCPSTLEIVKRIVNKLKISYKPKDFENPKLQLFWDYLKALALKYPAPSGGEDSTVPDLDGQSTRLGGLVEDFNNTFKLDGLPNSGTKRPNSEAKSREFSTSSKRAKQDDVLNLDDVRTAIQTKKVEKFTVAQLKEFLNENNIKTTNCKKKADYVSAIYEMKI